MEYDLHNSSGTDDEIQPSHFDRVSVGGHYSGTRRFVPNPVSYPRMQFDMESQIHQLEQEAYRSVLRAFKAQSDAISWEKEGLITELRKELRVSDDEHRELLSTVNTDDIICKIREWRKAGENQTGMFNVSQPIHDLLPSPPVSASWKKQKASQSGSLPFSRSMQGSHNQPAQSLPASSKWAPSFDAGGPKSRPGPQVPGLSGRYASTGPTPRGVSNGNGAPSLFLMNTNAEVARRDSLIGRKVMTRWPEDNNFYEAVITDYNPQEGRHALVYDKNTPKEAWEWVDLKEIPPEDIRWVDEDAGLSHQSGVGIQGPGDNNDIHGIYPNIGRGKGAMRDQNEKEFPLSENVVVKTSDEIEILHTDTLIKEVQKMFTSTHPNLLEIEKAKKMLKEHEQALMDVISKLGDAANSGSGAEQRSPHGQSMDVEQRWRNSLYGGNNHIPGSEAETRGARANGSVVANGSLNQQDDDIIEI
ncbi:ENT domain-containing protein [Heracleum sosnowskyi]|uniref:ENT domain-containing protein n=1 Tax=Heracleum sosnowskyi TaxID=360622 RepID=A0AAD8MVB4_9APIA|nr:ENT domain-containing protein [Heracleum sosnowskyi]